MLKGRERREVERALRARFHCARGEACAERPPHLSGGNAGSTREAGPGYTVRMQTTPPASTPAPILPLLRAILTAAAALCLLGGCANERGSRMAGPRTGTWELTGRDRDAWKAEMVFTKREGTQLEGYLNWRRVGGVASGHELFRGNVDHATGRVTLKGGELRLRRGDIASGATYEATVAGSGTELLNGRWFGKNVEPGTWSAVWRSREIPKR